MCIRDRCLGDIVTRFEWKSALAYPQEMFQCKCTIVLPSVFHLCEYNKDSATLTCSKSKVCIKCSVERHLSWFSEKGTSHDVRQSLHDTPLKEHSSISYQDVLDKPPETKDVLRLIKDTSASWNELGAELDVPLNDRESLGRDMRLSLIHISEPTRPY